MNERIKELALQAGFKSDRLGHLFGGDDIEKFAELLIKECAGVALWQQGKGYDVSELIKEHFGVEE